MDESQRFSGLQLLEPIGEGGYSTVFSAWLPADRDGDGQGMERTGEEAGDEGSSERSGKGGQLVAVKLLSRKAYTTEVQWATVNREMSMAQGLSHEHIVRGAWKAEGAGRGAPCDQLPCTPATKIGRWTSCDQLPCAPAAPPGDAPEMRSSHALQQLLARTHPCRRQLYTQGTGIQARPAPDLYLCLPRGCAWQVSVFGALFLKDCGPAALIMELCPHGSLDVLLHPEVLHSPACLHAHPIVPPPCRPPSLPAYSSTLSTWTNSSTCRFLPLSTFLPFLPLRIPILSACSSAPSAPAAACRWTRSSSTRKFRRPAGACVLVRGRASRRSLLQLHPARPPARPAGSSSAPCR